MVTAESKGKEKWTSRKAEKSQTHQANRSEEKERFFTQVEILDGCGVVKKKKRTEIHWFTASLKIGHRHKHSQT